MYICYEGSLIVQRIANGKKLSVADESRVRLTRWCTTKDAVVLTALLMKTCNFSRLDALKHSQLKTTFRNARVSCRMEVDLRSSISVSYRSQSPRSSLRTFYW